MKKSLAICLLGLGFCAWGGASAATPTTATLTGAGDVCFGAERLRLALCIHGEGWKGCASPANLACRFPDAKKGQMKWKIDTSSVQAHGWTRLVGREGGAAALDVEAVSEADQKPECISLTFTLPVSAFAGRSWSAANGERKWTGVLPAAFDPKKISLFHTKVQSFTLETAPGRTLTVAFETPQNLLVQDSRKWGANYSVRIGPGRPAFAKGAKVRFHATLTASEGLAVRYAEPVVVKAGPDWATLDYKKDILAGSALDFSGMGFRSAPAGQYGWLRNVRGHFEFEKLPGRNQRFYGVNLCFGANYPTHEMAEVLITRLARLGYNTIRIHHYERDLVKGSRDNHAFNAENIDRFDFLFAKGVENGFYFTTDLFVSRPVRWTDIGITDRGPGLIENKNNYKALVACWEPAFEDFKRFSHNFLLHRNPYTGRRYVEEPALPLISLINEGQITMGWTRGKELGNRDLPELAAWYRTWLAERRAKDAAFCPDAPDELRDLSAYGPHSAVMALFMADTERRNASRITAFLRDELGSRAMFTDANCGPHFAPMQRVRADCYDYVDDHFYVDHPHFLVKPWALPARVGTVNPVTVDRLPPTRVAWTRLPDKPFCITEWNFSGPGPYRGVGGIMTGAFSALQDWSGLWRFAYSHANTDWGDGVGVPGYFNTVTDPIGQAGDRASILLFLRRDLEPLAKKATLTIGETELRRTGGKALACAPAWGRDAWARQVSTSVSAAETLAGAGERFSLEAVSAAERAPFAAEADAEAASRAVRLDPVRGTFAIDTPRTAGGFAPEGALACGAVSFALEGAPATVWASSLDGQPIRASSRLLVTHLTDAQGDGNVYADETKAVLLKFGKAPAMVRKGKAEVRLALDAPEKYAVWALETSGKRLARVPARVEKGALVFTADVAMLPAATMLYEVVR